MFLFIIGEIGQFTIFQAEGKKPEVPRYSLLNFQSLALGYRKARQGYSVIVESDKYHPIKLGDYLQSFHRISHFEKNIYFQSFKMIGYFKKLILYHATENQIWVTVLDFKKMFSEVVFLQKYN